MVKLSDEERLLYSSAFVKQKEYWANKLSGGIEKTAVFPGHEKQWKGNREKIEIPLNFTYDVSLRLMKLSKKSDLSLYIILLSAAAALLYRWTNNEDITLLSPVCQQKASQRTINNWLLIRSRVDGRMTFKELLVQNRTTVLEAYENQDYPFDRLLEYLFDISQALDITGIACFLDTIHDRGDIEATTCSLAFSFVKEIEAVRGSVLYDPVIYGQKNIGRLANHFTNLLAGLLETIDTGISAISFLSQEEIKRLIFDLNDTEADYPRDKTVVELFEEQVSGTPGNIAVVYEDMQMESGELARKAARLAGVLAAKGFGPGCIAALIVEPCPEMIIGILGVLEAGGVFLPIEPELLPERVKYMLADTSTRILLTQHHLVEKFAPGFAGEILSLDDSRIYEYRGKSPGLTVRSSPVDPVYTIYTSGTTGRPKGVPISNRNLVNYIHWFIKAIDLTTADKAILTSSFAFDALYTQLFASLFKGCELHVVPREVFLLPDKLLKYFKKNGITYIKVTPSLFNLLVNSPGFSREKCRTLRFIMLGGEPINVKDAARCRNICGHIRMMNHYGPTETTIGATAQYIDFHRFDTYRENPTIGAPLDNYRAYILDKHMELVPEGAAGELCIAGDSVGLGYLNHVELTAEKFKPVPPGNYRSHTSHTSYNTHKSYILYKTGDLAQWQPDGHIKLLGRIDDQIKIRGYRIELGEIESQLLKHKDIEDAVVIDRESGAERYICAYVVSPGELSSSQLEDHLAARLPDYMIPRHFVQLERIPLTAHNKIHRQSLPEPQMTAPGQSDAPTNEIEKKLQGIWADVLKVEKDIIGINSNFFQLGGHSLKVTLAVSGIHRDLNIKLPLVQIFRTPTIKELARFIAKAAVNTFKPIEPVEEMEYYPLSSAQERLYVLQQLELLGTGYNVLYMEALNLDPDKKRLEQTVKRLIRRHESLRTSFQMIENEPVQRIHDRVEFSLEQSKAFAGGSRCFTGRFSRKEPHEASGPPEAIIKNFIRPFDLSRAPLLRMGLIQTPTGAILMSDMHHIITDRLSMQLFVREFIALYQGEELPPLKFRYRDYTHWQNRQKQSEAFKQQEAYWLRQFEGEVPVLHLPTDFTRPVVQSFAGSNLEFEIGPKETAALKKLASEQETTLFMLLLALFNVMLAKITGQEDIIVGTPIAARRHTHMEHIVGMFVNTLALKNYPAGEKIFLDFLAEVKKNALAAFENQDYPFEDLVEKVEVTRDTGRNPLFDVAFSFQGFDAELHYISAPGKNTPDYETGTAKFDLTLFVWERTNLLLNFEYCTKLFKKETIRGFVGYLRKILAMMLADPGKKTADMEIISTGEKQKVLYTFNNTTSQYPKDKTIHELFREQEEKIPDHTALVGTHETHQIHQKHDNMSYMSYTSHISYNQLNEKSNRLAHLLKDKGLQPETIVGIMAEPSPAVIIGILAILKAGGAYLPIDTDYPDKRISYMLADSSAKVLITTGTLAKEVKKFRSLEVKKNLEIIFIDSIEFSVSSSSHLLNFSTSHSTNLAYIMYTSGSTGIPKGVMVRHRNVVRLVQNTNYICFREDESILQTGSLSFDASTFEIWGALLNGLKLYLTSKQDLLAPSRLKAALTKWEITTIWMTSSLYNHMSQADIELFSRLRYLLVGGDVLSSLHINRVKQKYPQLVIINGYGPTENTTFSTTYRVKGDDAVNIPIGKPIANSTAYILDRHGYPVPIGITGELLVGGDGAARGYLNNPELTCEKFDRDLWDYHDNHDRNHRSYRSHQSYISYMSYYRTGDLARWLPDGNIEFLGRIDQQVKIRGYRVEPGEIETHLQEVGFVEDVVITARQDEKGEKYLCAYYVPVPGGGYDKTRSGIELKKYLAKKIPQYMIPSYFVPLEKIPLTNNGKVNRNALPEPELTVKKESLGPRDEIEEKLVEIWTEVLDVKTSPGLQSVIGIDDNFFELGGHSLKATIMQSKIHKTFNAKVGLEHILRFQTIRQLAEFIKMQEPEKFYSIPPAPLKEYYPVTMGQKWMYFSHLAYPGTTVLNIPVINEITGVLDKEKLEKNFRQLMRRHETLRTSFIIVDGEPVLRVHDEVEFAIEYFSPERKEERHAPGAMPCASTIKNFVRPFDLSRPPLLRVGLIKIDNDKHTLMIDMHHIISDGTSLGIFMKELNALDRGETLPGLKRQYKDYAQWQKSKEKKGLFKKQETYWLNQLSGEIPLLNLPYDYPLPGVRSYEGGFLNFDLHGKEIQGLKEQAKKTGSTLFILLLAVYNVMLYQLSGQEDIIVGTTAAGRTNIDLQPLIGMFSTAPVCRNYPSGEKTFTGFLKEVRDRTLQVYENQEYPLEELDNQLKLRKNPARGALYDVVFVLENMEMTNLDLPGSTLETRKFEKGISKYHLTFEGIDMGNKILFNVEYAAKLFKKETVENFIDQFKTILSSVLEEPGKKISQIGKIRDKKNHLPYEKTGKTAFTGNLSNCALAFLEFVKQNPDGLNPSHYRSLESPREPYKLQPWPTFINRQTKNELEEASVNVFNLIKSIPRRIFSYDPQKLSAYYGIPVEVVKHFLFNVSEEHMSNLLGRGDFLFSSTGLKCIEFNIASNIGGWQIPIWEDKYYNVPIISRFIKTYKVKLTNKNLLALLLDHLLKITGETFPAAKADINIAIVTPDYVDGDLIRTREKYLNRLYKDLLQQKYNNGAGEIILCDYPHLYEANGNVLYKNKRIYTILEYYGGDVPMEMMAALEKGNLLIYNGLITELMANKLNLAILSENEDTNIFTPAEKETIKKYIPWTRKIKEGETVYAGENIHFPGFILSHREHLAIKMAEGLGGEDVYIGSNMPESQWQELVQKALREKNWIVQEYVESLSYLYLSENQGCKEHAAVWGLFVFGSRYAGGVLRVLPKTPNNRIINATYGATSSVILEVEEYSPPER